MSNQPGLKPYHNHYGFDLNGSGINGSLLHTLLVNTCTGNAVLSVLDFAAAGRTGPSIGRTYNSQDPNIDDPVNEYVGGFGPGWTWIYDERIECESANNTFATYYDSSGAKHIFLYDSGYVSPEGLYLQLSYISGIWTLTDENGVQRKFYNTGKLKEIVIPDGSKLEFAFSNHQLEIKETPYGGSTRRVFLVQYDTSDEYILTIEIGPSGGSANLMLGYNYRDDILDGIGILDGVRLSGGTDAIQWSYDYDYQTKRLVKILDAINSNSAQPKYTSITYTLKNLSQVSPPGTTVTAALLYFVESVVDNSGAATLFDWESDLEELETTLTVTDPALAKWTYYSKPGCVDPGSALIIDKTGTPNISITGEPDPQLAGWTFSIEFISPGTSGYDYRVSLLSPVLSRNVFVDTDGEFSFYGIDFVINSASVGDKLTWIYPHYEFNALTRMLTPLSQSDDPEQPCAGHKHQIDINYQWDEDTFLLTKVWCQNHYNQLTISETMIQYKVNTDESVTNLPSRIWTLIDASKTLIPRIGSSASTSPEKSYTLVEYDYAVDNNRYCNYITEIYEYGDYLGYTDAETPDTVPFLQTSFTYNEYFQLTSVQTPQQKLDSYGDFHVKTDFTYDANRLISIIAFPHYMDVTDGSWTSDYLRKRLEVECDVDTGNVNTVSEDLYYITEISDENRWTYIQTSTDPQVAEAPEDYPGYPSPTKPYTWEFVYNDDHKDRIINVKTPRLTFMDDIYGLNTWFYYDGIHRLNKTEVYNHIKGLPGDDPQTTEFTFDNMGNITLIESEEGRRDGFKYDDCYRVIEQSVSEVDENEHIIFMISETYKYDKCGRLISMNDGDGFTWEIVYYADGSLYYQKDPSGAKYWYEYNDLGQPYKIIDPQLNVTYLFWGSLGFIDTEYRDLNTYTNLSGMLSAVRSPEGRMTAYFYDMYYRLAMVREIPRASDGDDPLKNLSEWKLHTIASPRTNYLYDADGKIKNIIVHNTNATISNDNLIWGFEYYPNGALKHVHFPNNYSETVFNWNNPSELIYTDKEPHRKYYYDGMGRLVMVDYPNACHDDTSPSFLKGFEFFEYKGDQPYLMRYVFSPMMGAKIREYKYDNFDRVNLIRKIVSRIEHSTDSDPSDYLELSTDPAPLDQNVLNITYDSLNRVTQIDNLSLGNLAKWKMYYDVAGRTTDLERYEVAVDDDTYKIYCNPSVYVSYGELDRKCWWHYWYNKRSLTTGVELRVVTPSAEEAVPYDPVSPAGSGVIHVDFKYDCNGQLIQIDEKDITLGAGSSADILTRKFKYNKRGDLTDHYNAKGGHTEYKYYPDGYLRSIHDPLNGSYDYQYDEYGQLKRYTGPNGVSYDYYYDLSGRRLAVINSSGTKSGVIVVYDNNGNILKHTDGNGIVTEFEYDRCDRVITRTRKNGTEDDITTRYFGDDDTHFADSILMDDGVHLCLVLEPINSDQTDPDKAWIKLYDTEGNLITVWDPVQTSPTPVARQSYECTYNIWGDMIQTKDFEGNVINYTYDMYGRLIGRCIANGAVADVYLYYYDCVRMSRALQVLAINPLTHEPTSYIEQKFEYDGYKRLIKETKRGYPASPSPLEPKDEYDHEYDYDPLGNIRRYRFSTQERDGSTPKQRETDYAFNPRGDLNEMSEPKDPSDPESEHEYTRFYYDQGGRLKQMAFPNGVSRRWEYDLADRVVADITINRFGICDRYFYTYNSGCKVTEEDYTRGEFPMAYYYGYYYHDNQYYQIPDTDQSANWLGFFGMGYNYPPPLPEPPEDAYDPLLEEIQGQPPSGGGTGGDLYDPTEEMKYLCETGFLGVKKRTEPGQPTFPTRDSDYDIFFNFNFSEVYDWHTQKYEYDSAGRMTKSTYINDSVNLPNVLEYDLNGRVTKKEYRDATSLLNTHTYEYSDKGFISKVKINAAEYDITTNANGCITGNDLSGYDFTYNEYNQLATGTKRDWIPITFKDKNGLTWTTAYKPSFIDRVDAFWRWIHGERRWIIDTSGYPPPHEWAGPSGETWDFMTRRLFYAGGVMVQDEWENKNPMVDGSNWCVPDDEADKSLVPKYYRVNEDYSGQPSPDNLWLHYNYHNGRNISWDWGFDLSDWSMSRRERVTYDKLGTPQKTYKSDSWDDSKTVSDLSGSQRSPDAHSPSYSEADSAEDQVYYTLGPSGMIDSFVEQMEQIKWSDGSKQSAPGEDTISGKMFFPNHGFGAAMWQGGIWLPFMPAPPGLIPPLPGGTVRTPPSSASEQYEYDHGKPNWVITPSIEWDLKPVPARPNCDPGFNPKPYYGPGSDRMSADFMGSSAYNNPNFGLPSDGGGSFIGLGRFDSACNIPNDMQPSTPSGGLFGPDFGIGLWGFPGYDPDWRHVPGGWIYSPDLPTMPLYFFPDDIGMFDDPMPALPNENPGLPGLNIVPGSMTVTDAPAGWGKATWKERQPRLLGSSGGLLSRIGNAIKRGLKAFADAVTGAVKAVSNAVTIATKAVSKAICTVVKSISKAVMSAVKALTSAISTLPNHIFDFLGSRIELWSIAGRVLKSLIVYKYELFRELWKDPNLNWFVKILFTLPVIFSGATNTLVSIIAYGFDDTNWPKWSTHCRWGTRRLFYDVGNNWKYWEVQKQCLPGGWHAWLRLRLKDKHLGYIDQGYYVDPWIYPITPWGWPIVPAFPFGPLDPVFDDDSDY